MHSLHKRNQMTVSPDSLRGEVLLDSRGRICGVNEAAEGMIGRPLQEIEGRPIDGAVDNQRLCALMQYALVSTETVVGRVRIRNGPEQEVRVAVGPVSDSSGRRDGSLRFILEATPQG
jgi:PAS domain S-box-containing protein